MPDFQEINPENIRNLLRRGFRRRAERLIRGSSNLLPLRDERGRIIDVKEMRGVGDLGEDARGGPRGERDGAVRDEADVSEGDVRPRRRARKRRLRPIVLDAFGKRRRRQAATATGDSSDGETAVKDIVDSLNDIEGVVGEIHERQEQTAEFLKKMDRKLDLADTKLDRLGERIKTRLR